MSWTTLQDTSIILDPNQLATDQGWTISDGVAYHDGCFGGYIILEGIEVEAGKSYILNFETKYWTSGSVYAIVGGVNGTPRTGIGEWKNEQFDVPDDATDLSIQFYSAGTLGISYFNTYPTLEDSNNGHTLGFNAEDNRWTTEYSYQPQMMLKFIDQYFSFENGRLWKHNDDTIDNYNTFYGIFSGSKVKIIVNVNPTQIKNYFTMRLKSNKAWSAIEITLPPTQGKATGQRSRIKKGNFKSLNNGDFFAAFLRNLDDPRFSTELQALMQGALLQGSYAEITLENDDNTLVRMLSTDIEVSPQNYTY